MPHAVRKRGDGWVIIRLGPGGKTTTVGHSRSKRKALISASIRDRADRGSRRSS